MNPAIDPGWNLEVDGLMEPLRVESRDSRLASPLRSFALAFEIGDWPPKRGPQKVLFKARNKLILCNSTMRKLRDRKWLAPALMHHNLTREYPNPATASQSLIASKKRANAQRPWSSRLPVRNMHITSTALFHEADTILFTSMIIG